MPITVIPAPDQSGAIAGWQALADSIRRRNEAKRTQQTNYQELVLKLSAPDTTEDQQNAILTQDPKQFEAQYGVPLANVGKDVAKFRTAATDAVSTQGSQGAGGGMVMSRTEPAGSKRVLVEHPEGTPAEQAAAANIGHVRAETEQSQATTTAEQQRTQYYQQQLGLNANEAKQKDVAFQLGLRGALRTKEGKTPTPGQVQDYMSGTFDLYPTTEAGKRLDNIREILGGDPNDPATGLMQHDMMLDSNIKDADLERLRAEIGNYRAEADLRKARADALAKGIDPDTGLEVKQFEPKDMIAVNDAFNKALNNATGSLGLPTQVRTDKPWLTTMIPTGVTGASIPLSLAWFSEKVSDNPKLGPAIFGSGSADPAQVRADLQATVEPGQRIKTIDVPGVDKKTGVPTMLPLTIDQAVPVVTQMRRKLATEMPGVFAAMRTVSPRTLAEIANGNPLVLQMARAYAPDVAELVTKAQAEFAAARAGAAGATATAPVDPNVAPILDLRNSMQREIDDLKSMIQGKAVAPPRTDKSR